MNKVYDNRRRLPECIASNRLCESGEYVRMNGWSCPCAWSTRRQPTNMLYFQFHFYFRLVQQLNTSGESVPRTKLVMWSPNDSYFYLCLSDSVPAKYAKWMYGSIRYLANNFHILTIFTIFPLSHTHTRTRLSIHSRGFIQLTKTCAICESHQNDVQIQFECVGCRKWHGRENDIFFFILPCIKLCTKFKGRILDWMRKANRKTEKNVAETKIFNWIPCESCKKKRK